MNLYFTDCFELPLPPEHRFPMAKYRLLRERLAADSTRCFKLRLPHASPDRELRLAHTEEYLQRIVRGDLSRVEEKRIGFPWSTELITRSRYSTGATVCAVRDALTSGAAANLAGGTHHAFADAAAGYCVFNDAIVAARVAQRDHGVNQIIVIDCDVHQGNGTASLAENDPTIFTISIHGERNYPFRKTQSDLDVPLPDGTEDADYLSALSAALELGLRSCSPELAIYIAGADPYHDDRLGRLKVTRSGLAERNRVVYEMLKSRSIPVALAMGGGYANNHDDIVAIHADAVQMAHDMMWHPESAKSSSIDW